MLPVTRMDSRKGSADFTFQLPDDFAASMQLETFRANQKTPSHAKADEDS